MSLRKYDIAEKRVECPGRARPAMGPAATVHGVLEEVVAIAGHGLLVSQSLEVHTEDHEVFALE